MPLWDEPWVLHYKVYMSDQYKQFESLQAVLNFVAEERPDHENGVPVRIEGPQGIVIERPLLTYLEEAELRRREW